MSRRGPVREEVYEERGGYYRDSPPPQDYYLPPERVERIERVERDYRDPLPEARVTERVERIRAPAVRTRDLEEIDYSRTRIERDRQPEFLRREYAPVEEQPLVLRAREVETFTRPVRRSPPRERSPSIERVRTRERIVERERERSPSPTPVERISTRTRIVERERERSPSPAPVERISTRTRIVERERERSPSPAPVERVSTRTRVVERERERSLSPAQSERISRTRIDVRERSGSLDTRDGYSTRRVVERDTRERFREPSAERVRTTTRTVERERERSPSPLHDRERETIRTRVVERERRRSPSIESSPSPEPEPPIIRAPPIHQEIITHHRHIDHGYDFAPAPTPPPSLPRPRPVERERERERETEIDIHTSKNNTEIDIYRSSTRDRPRERSLSPAPSPARRPVYEADVAISSDRERLHVSTTTRESDRRSVSARPERSRGYDDEAEYYGRKMDERAYIGEAYNGATKDWAIVDVPPGTERVKMDGVGGASQEVTWQRYNGVRRSKFIPERDSGVVATREFEREEITDRRVGRPVERSAPPMWTEITKDLVLREAIIEMGYDFEETEFFYYVMRYLRYEDVMELVRLSDEIRYARKRRIRDMAYERERLKEVGLLEPVPVREPRRLMPAGYEEERIYERDVLYDSGGRRGNGRYMR